MNQDDRNARKSPDSKSGGQSVLLYVAAAAVGVSLLVMLLVKNSATVINYQQLLQLIDASANSPEGAIEIVQRQNDRDQREQHPSSCVHCLFLNLMPEAIGDTHSTLRVTAQN